MSIPINTDNSVQPTLTFTTLSTPENLDTWTKNNTSNIYNTSLGNVAIGTTTTNTYKLNVNGSLNATLFYGDGVNITNIAYANINGKPTNFQADWNSTIINKPSTFPADLTNYYNKSSTDTLLNGKQNTLTFSSPLLNTANTISIDLTNYYSRTEVNGLSTLTNFYNKTSTDTLLNGKQNTLTFSSPLLNTANTISIDLTNYYNKTEVNGLSTLTNFYNKTSTDTLLNGKQNTLTFSSPLLNTANTISIDLTNYYNKTSIDTLLNGKQNTLTFSSPLLNTANTISIDLTNYYNKTSTDTLLNGKQNTLTASTTIIGVGSNISLINYNNLSNLPNLSQYTTTTQLASYLPLTGGTITGNIINTGTNASFYFGGGGGAAFGQASGAGAFSSSALVGDCIVRSQGTKQLILQSGSGAGGIIINSANDTIITGQLTLKNNFWHQSADGILRFFYENNGTTYFHSGNTGSDGFKFRNFAQSDIFTITDAVNVSATGNITTNGIVVSNSGISTFKSIYITNPNNSQTHLPFTNGENYIRGKVNIDQDNLFVGGTTTLNSTLNVSGITTLNSTLNVSGIATLSSTLSTPQITTSAYNNLLLKSIEIYPFSSVGGAYNNGYWLIDVQDYCSQAGFVYLFLNINSPGFLYWQGRAVIANSSSINFYNDMAYNVNLSLISASSRLKIAVACPSGTNNGFLVMYVKIMG